jgi:hypothetical protein
MNERKKEPDDSIVQCPSLQRTWKKTVTLKRGFHGLSSAHTAEVLAESPKGDITPGMVEAKG